MGESYWYRYNPSHLKRKSLKYLIFDLQYMVWNVLQKREICSDNENDWLIWCRFYLSLRGHLWVHDDDLQWKIRLRKVFYLKLGIPLRWILGYDNEQMAMQILLSLISNKNGKKLIPMRDNH